MEKNSSREIIDGIIKLITLSYGDRAIHTYKEEPIPKKNPSLPTKYYEMRKISRDMPFSSLSETFAKEALFMRDHEDAYEIFEDYERTYPSYSSMNDAQLRTYFTWRTTIRKGIKEPTSLSYALVYVFELINLYHDEEGFFLLRDFFDKFSPIVESLGDYSYLMYDYVIYNSLDRSLLENSPLYAYDISLEVLIDYKSRSPEEVFSAMMNISSYKSQFFHKKTDFCSAAVYYLFDKLCEKYTHQLIMKRIAGAVKEERYRIFSSALFHPSHHHENGSYKISTATEYICRGGEWYIKAYFGRGKSSKFLFSFLKTADSFLRRLLGFKQASKPGVLDGDTVSEIETILSDFIDLCRQKYSEEKRVKINHSLIDGIKKDSDDIKDALITSFELDISDNANTENAPSSTAPNICDVADSSDAPTRDDASSDIHSQIAALSESEISLLAVLLSNGDSSIVAQRARIPLSVMAESINEKLYSLFEDNVIDSSDEYTIFDDYKDDLSSLILSYPS